MLDYVQDGENACFYEAKNASDLCGKMEDFLKNPERRETIGSNAADYVKKVHKKASKNVNIVFDIDTKNKTLQELQQERNHLC